MDYLLHILWVVLVISGIIIAVWLFDGVSGTRAGHGWRKILWMVLAVCLMFPVPLHFNTAGDAFYRLEVTVDIPEQIGASAKEDNALANRNTDRISDVESVGAGQNDQFLPLNAVRLKEKKQISTEKAIVGLWIIGALVIIVFRMGQYYRMKKAYMTGSFLCEEEAVRERADLICQELGIKRKIPIRIMKREKEHHNSPMLLGYMNPVLLFPDVSYTPNEINGILRHELIHYRSGDLWYKLFVILICDIYWFDPVLRLMQNMAFRDVECVCDEKVTGNMDLDGKRDYSNTILKTMSGVKKNGYSFTTQFFENKKSAKERFNNIFSIHNKKAGIGLLCLFLLMLMTGTACVSITSNEKEETNASREEMQEQQAIPEEIKRVTIASGILPEDHDSLLDELKEKYPDYEIDVTDFNWDHRMALLENTEKFPTIFPVYSANTQELAASGQAADITDILEKKGWADQMDDAFKTAVSDQEGRLYGIPKAPYAFGLMVNREMFRKAGLVDETGTPLFPVTWEELAEDAVKIKNVTGEAGFCMVAKDTFGAVQFLNLAWNFGAADFVIQESDGGYKANLDSDEAIGAMEFVKDLQWKYDVLTSDPALENYNTGYEHIANGTAAMWMGASDALFLPAAYGMEAEEIAMGPIPAGPGGKQYSYSSGQVFMFSKDASPEEIEVALTLLEMLGLGPAANDGAKSRIYDRQQKAADQGGPLVPEISVWNNAELLAYEHSVITELGDTDQTLYQSFFDKVHTPGNLKGETYPANSELCMILSSVLYEVVKNPDADVVQLMKDANDEWQKAIDA